MNNLFTTIGGRKFALVTLVVILTTLLTWFEKIGETTFSYVICAVVITYISGNVFQKTQDAKANQYTPTDTTSEKTTLLNE